MYPEIHNIKFTEIITKCIRLELKLMGTQDYQTLQSAADKVRAPDHGFVIWLTGLPGSGKTTIAKNLYPKLKEAGLKVEIFDGDEVRKQLSPDLGFTKRDRESHA